MNNNTSLPRGSIRCIVKQLINLNNNTRNKEIQDGNRKQKTKNFKGHAAK